MLIRSLLLIATAVACGCYSPVIEDGDFLCTGSQPLCPEGFSCALDGRCHDPGWPGAGDLDLTAMGASGTLTLNATSGAIVLTAGDGTSMTLLAAQSTGFELMTPASGSPVGLWTFGTLTIPPTVTVQPSTDSGGHVAALAATTMTIEGSLRWLGYGGFGGSIELGGSAPVMGSAGGGASTDASGPGGGGGGYGSAGQAGSGSGGGAAGQTFGTIDLNPIFVGAGGGGGGGPAGSTPGSGANGGGALALFATNLKIGGTLDVSGSDGSAGTAGGGGGGGGSGGSLLVSGQTVELEAGHALLAKGGAAGPPSGGAGGDGRIWIGAGTLSPTINSQPMPTVSQQPLLHFPR